MSTTPSHELPFLRVERCDATRREPGLMLFNIRPGGTADQSGGDTWLVGVDPAGDVAFMHRSDAAVQDTRRTQAGHILFSRSDARIVEMSLSGKVLRHWYATGKWRDRPPPAGGIPIDMPLFHHAINVLPGGHLLLLGMEIREYDDWPASETDPGAGRATERVVGDVLTEVTGDGEVVGEWRMLDLLDPYRICYGSRARYWDRRGFPGSMDWCHGNGTAYDADDDAILVSLRTQDCIVKFCRATGRLQWILGTHANWNAPWADSLLEPLGELTWPFHQHDCSVTPGGTVLCFDNGNYRATPYDSKMSPESSYSRAVEYSIDPQAGTVEQVWSYGEARTDRTFACYQGGAFRLPRTGNTFIDYGGICTRDGVPVAEAMNGFSRARLLEVTPAGEPVFDMWIDGAGEDPPRALSSFRAEHFQETE